MKPWTPDDIQKLRDLCEKTTIGEASVQLGRTILSLQRRTKELGIRFRYIVQGGPVVGLVTRIWTADDDRVLVSMAGERSAGEIARVLGRTGNAVMMRMRKLGIDHRQGTCSTEQAAKILGVSGPTVRSYRDRLGYKWATRTRQSIRPGPTNDDISEIAHAILRNERSRTTVAANRLRKIADGEF